MFYEIFQGRVNLMDNLDSLWYWRAKTANGREVADYSSKSGCRRALIRFLKAIHAHAGGFDIRVIS